MPPTVAFLSDLRAYVQLGIQQAQTYSQLPGEELQWRPAPKSWSVLECLEHLNRYGDFYLEEFRNTLNKAAQQPQARVKSSWLGNYLAKSMLPQAGRTKLKMPTLPNKNPIHSSLGPEVAEEFIRQQKALLCILDQAVAVDLNNTKCRLTLPVFKLNLADTLRFVIYHQERHRQQAERAHNAYTRQTK